jgi:hypothetical protein
MDEEAGTDIPPIVLVGTIAIGYRVMEAELREGAAAHGYSPEELWAEVDALRRSVLKARQRLIDRGEVA